MLVDPLLEVNWSSHSNLWSQTGRMTKGHIYRPYSQTQTAACRARRMPPRHGSNQTGFRLCHTRSRATTGGDTVQ